METVALNVAGSSGTGPSIAPNDPRFARCGFAKLQGEGIEFFIRKYEITIGRTSKNSTLDLILGDSTTISRQHATIRFNFGTKCFELVVLGKNGVTVESSGSGATHLYTPDSPPTPLRSRDLLVMGEKRFYFLLPRAMGIQSRKRRRLEPSPAPGVVPQPLAAPALPLTQQPHHQASVSAQQPLQAQHAQQQQSVAAAGASASAAGPEGAVPLSTAPHLQHTTQTQQEHPALQQPQDVYTAAQTHGGTIGAPAELARQQQQQVQQAYHMQQHDDDDALINSSALPYDNGEAYGYGDGSNGFPGGF